MLPPSRRLSAPAALLVVALLALAARLSPWSDVFTLRGVRFLNDSDPHYHVLRAERLLDGRAADVWFDRGLAYPEGAVILWPPGFDALVAGAARTVHGSSPTRADLEQVAAFVPAVLGVLSVLLQALVALRWLGPVAALAAGVIAALLPGQVQFGALGATDQHIAEQLGLIVALLGLDACARGRRSGPLLVALACAAGPWAWQGFSVVVAFSALATMLVWIARPEGEDAASALVRRVAAGGAAGAGVLMLSIAAWGAPAALGGAGLNGLSWFHPLSTAAAALALAGLARLGARPAWTTRRRAATAALACVVATAAAFALMPSPLLHGLRSLSASDPWLRTIDEFQPAFFGRGSTLPGDLSWAFWTTGPALLAPLLGLGAFRRRWARDPGARTALTLLASGTATFVPLFLARSRFVAYAAPFFAWWGALLLADLLERARAERGRAGRVLVAAGAAVALAFPAVQLARRPFRPAFDERLLDLLASARANGGGRAILSPWTLGHIVQYYAGAPAVVTPFGTDVGDRGMRRLAAFEYARTPEEAERVLRGGEIGWVLIDGALGPLGDAYDFAPAGAVPLVAGREDYLGRGRSVSALPTYASSLPGRLYVNDGAPFRSWALAGIPFLRLAGETSGQAPYKLFERVEGARILLRGARPGEEVGAYVEIVTAGGRRLQWWSEARADNEGLAVLRVPYATGRNGSSTASRYVIRAGDRIRDVEVPEAAVIGGALVEARFDGDAPVLSAAGSGG